jgi:hypothetical protein
MTISEQPAGLLACYVGERELARERGKGLRALRDERQRGDGPPYLKDGKIVRYSIEDWRAWLKAKEIVPVHAGRPATREYARR